MQSTDVQIDTPAADPATPSAQGSTSVKHGRYRLTVRAETGNLRIVAIWQALGCKADRAEHVRTRVDRRHGFEEMTITFAAVPPDTLGDMVNRLIALPWTLDVYFYP
jgi:hypothetical protein